MWRRMVRSATPVLVLALTLTLSGPRPAASGGWNVLDTLWGWLTTAWLADGGTAPTGGTSTPPDDGDRGAGNDPDGLTAEGYQGPGLAPNS